MKSKKKKKKIIKGAKGAKNKKVKKSVGKKRLKKKNTKKKVGKKSISKKKKASVAKITKRKKSSGRSSEAKKARKKFLKKIIEELKKERLSLQERIESAKRDEWMGTVNDEIDTAVASAERDIMFERVDRFVQRLDEIENALRKVKKGKFGICEKCNGEISARRLKLIPYARYCFKCMA